VVFIITPVLKRHGYLLAITFGAEPWLVQRRRDNGWPLFSMSPAKWLRNQRLNPRLIGV